MNLKNLFSINTSYDNQYLIINVFTLKIKINKLKHIKISAQNINKNKIVFCNYFGNSYGCNPKYITEELLKQNLPFEIVWLVKNKDDMKKFFPQGIRLENYYSKEGIKELLSAKIWVDNMRKSFFWNLGFKKKEEQYYIQTWHGSLGIKKIEGDIKNEDPKWRKLAKIDSSNIDIMLSNSTFLNNLYGRENCFWYDGSIEKIGHPRNDIFFKNEKDTQIIINKVRTNLNIPPNNKIVLYVPTFRDDGDTKCLNIDFNNMRNAFEQKFGCKYSVILRLHPLVSQKEKTDFIKDNIIDGGSYPDIQELLLASDIVISDYSSCMFDFMLTRRPVFIYASDIEIYNTDRGFYFPLETTPFPIATNNEELIENITGFNYDKYRIKVENFLEEKGCMEDGHASERVVKIIKDVIDRG